MLSICLQCRCLTSTGVFPFKQEVVGSSNPPESLVEFFPQTTKALAIQCFIYIHSKNSRVRFDPEKGPMGPDPFLGQTDLESG